MSDDFRERVQERVNAYKDMSQACGWLERNWDRVQRMLADGPIQQYVFGPFAELMAPAPDDTDGAVRAVITQVAVINAVLAGLPGQLGIGVMACQAFEIWMAYRIARRVGIQVETPRDLLTYFALAGGVLILVVGGMRLILHLLYPLFAWFPLPMVPVELLATDLVGVIFWVGFKEAAEKGSFGVPPRLIMSVRRETVSLFKYQWVKLKALLTIENLKVVGGRMREWFSGEIVAPTPPVPDDAIVALAMASLVTGQIDRIEGPLGQIFLQSIRDLYPALAGASTPAMAEMISHYSDEQMPGVLANIKGRFFERLVEASENADGDLVFAELHADRSYPSTDLVIEDTEAHTLYAVSLKATDDPRLIEEALQRYPHDQILTTSEVAAYYEGSPQVSDSGISNEALTQVTANNFEELLNQLPPSPADWTARVGAGQAVAATIALWPFVAAYLRKRIGQEELKRASVRVLGRSGRNFAVKLAGAVVIGPLFAWWLLARAAQEMARSAGIDDRPADSHGGP